MKLLTKKQVAESLGVHIETIRRLVADKKFPAPIKLGTEMQSAVRFDEADVEQWLADQKATSAEQ